MTASCLALLRYILVPACLLAVPAGALAAEPDCKDAITTPAMNACAWAGQQQVEARLNAVYRKTLQQLEDEGPPRAAARKKLIVAQRAWIKFRDADCDAVDAKWAGGTIHTLMHIGCLRRHAERRIEDLEAFTDTQGR